MLGRVAKHPGAVVARLGQRRHRADLDMAKAEGRGGGPGRGVFVEAGGQPDRIGETYAKGLDRAGLRGGQPVPALQQPAQGTNPPEQRQGIHRQLMRLLGIEPEEDAPRNLFVKRTHICRSLKSSPEKASAAG